MVASAQENPLKKKTSQIGTYGTLISSGIPDEEYLAILKGKDAAVAFDKMRTQDPQIKMALSSILSPLKSANWEIEPVSTDDQDRIFADFIEFILFCDMIRGFPVFLNEALTFIPFGHSLFEIIHKNVANHPKWGNYTGLHSLSFRSQKTLEEFNVDTKTGELLSVRQNATGDLQVDVIIPSEFLVLFTMDLEGADYPSTTRSLLRPCYGPWFRKQIYLKIRSIGLEKHAIGTPIGTVPANLEKKEDREEFIKVLQRYSFHQNQYIIKPEGFELEIIQGNFDAEKVNSAIKQENEEIARAFLANFLNLGQDGSGGAYALGSDLSDFFLRSIKYIANVFTDVMNTRVIPHIIDINFGEQQEYPKLKVTDLEDFGLEFAQTISTLTGTGNLTADSVLEAHIRRRLKLPKQEEVLVAQGTITAPTQTTQPSETPNPTENERDAASDTQQDLSHVPRETQLVDVWDEIQFAESARSLIKQGTDGLAEVMTIHLDTMGNKLITDIINRFNNLPPASKQKATSNIKIGGKNAYKKALKNGLGNLAALSTNSALSELSLKQINFQEDGEPRNFPNSKKKKLPRQTQIKMDKMTSDLVETQSGDMEKAVILQFGSSVEGTADPGIIAQDLREKKDKVIKTAAVAGAGVAAADMVNFARNEIFFDEEFNEEVGSFTFSNPNPISAICRQLQGRVLRVDDVASQRFFPPLHFNCKSFLIPNLKGTTRDKRAQTLISAGGKESSLTNVTQEALDSINFIDKPKTILLQSMVLDSHERVQNFIFDRKIWSEGDIKHFLSEQGFRSDKLEMINDFMFARQDSVFSFKEGSLNVRDIGQGVQAVIGVDAMEVDVNSIGTQRDTHRINIVQLSNKTKRVQSVVFDRKIWSKEDAKTWLSKNEMDANKLEVYDAMLLSNQKAAGVFKENTFKTHIVSIGVKVLVGEIIMDGSKPIHKVRAFEDVEVIIRKSRKLAGHKDEDEEEEDLQATTEVQTLIFDKNTFSREAAIAWARDHDFKVDKVDETDTSFRIRQVDPDEFVPGSFRTIDIDTGIKAVIGRRKE